MTGPEAEDAFCPVCESSFVRRAGTSKPKVYCCRRCANLAHRERMGNVGYGSVSTTGDIGAMHEMMVATDLLRRGWEVFRSVSPSSSCDLVIGGPG